VSWFKRREQTPYEVVLFRNRKHPILMRGDRRLAYFTGIEDAQEFCETTAVPFTDLKEW
jgi:hypothetical protein